jgi:predicted peptidase
MRLVERKSAPSDGVDYGCFTGEIAENFARFGKMKHLFLIIFTAVFSFSCAAQPRPKTAETSKFEAKTYQTMPYRLFIPANYDNAKKYPLVLWLHGGGARGNDNEKQITEGNTLGATIWTRAENQAENPAFVLAPQAPVGEWWANNDSELRPSTQLQIVVELLAELQKQYNLDANRLYVAGQSMGGYGTWSIIAEYPEMFAAAIPICGGGNVAKADKMTKTAIWAFHGEIDQAVKVEQSREMIEAIKKAGGNPKYTEYQGVGHNSWINAFAEPDIVSWVFAQRRK